jgi:hypothetical protein
MVSYDGDINAIGILSRVALRDMLQKPVVDFEQFLKLGFLMVVAEIENASLRAHIY